MLSMPFRCVKSQDQLVYSKMMVESKAVAFVTLLMVWQRIAGADPGFWERGGANKYIRNWGRVREGACPSRDSKGVWGSADYPSGVWGEAPAAFLLLRLFSIKCTVISNTYITRYPDY